MKRLLIPTILCVTYLVFGVGATSAKKKPEKPIQEQFEATISPMISPRSMTIAIEEFSTNDEMQAIAQAFAKGGEDAVESSMRKIKKGYYQIERGEVMPIELIQLKSAAGVRSLGIVGEASDRFQGTSPDKVFIGHRGYPYTFIEIEVDQQGNGKGLMIPFAKLVFNKQGQMVVEPMEVGTGIHASFQLINVHWTK